MSPLPWIWGCTKEVFEALASAVLMLGANYKYGQPVYMVPIALYCAVQVLIAEGRFITANGWPVLSTAQSQIKMVNLTDKATK